MSRLKKILVLSDSDRLGENITLSLEGRFQVITQFHFNFDQIQNDGINFEFILIDYAFLSDFKFDREIDFYKEKLVNLKKYFNDAAVLLLVDHRHVEHASPLLTIGFENIIQIPFSKDLLIHRLSMEEERSRFKAAASDTSKDIGVTKNVFYTENKKFAEELEKIEQIAKSRTTILITGESGTGKSLLAKYIHQLSGRNEYQFVDVHCGAIPESLVESELFGHEKGAFTGAIKRKIGKFEMSNKGTIFLDEIGTVSKSIQVKMLQVLQERFIQRVGGEANIPLDIRVIAATNNNLKEAVQAGDFREDLFYRLNVFHIELPALRDRIEDLPSLCQSIIEKLNSLYGKNIKSVSQEVISIFNNYNWPGNVRELENILERAYVLEKETEIKASNIPRELIPASKEVLNISPLDRKSIGLIEARKEATDSFEKKYLTELLIAHNGKVSAMAKEAEVTVRQLHKLLAKHSIKPKSFSILLDEEEHKVLNHPEERN